MYTPARVKNGFLENGSDDFDETCTEYVKWNSKTFEIGSRKKKRVVFR